MHKIKRGVESSEEDKKNRGSDVDNEVSLLLSPLFHKNSVLARRIALNLNLDQAISLRSNKPPTLDGEKE